MNPMGKMELRIMVRMKLAMRSATEAYTMACMVDLPTPTAPFLVFRPSRQEMREMMSPKTSA
mgnify:CR=1 FL=1